MAARLLLLHLRQSQCMAHCLSQQYSSILQCAAIYDHAEAAASGYITFVTCIQT